MSPENVQFTPEQIKVIEDQILNKVQCFQALLDLLADNKQLFTEQINRADDRLRDLVKWTQGLHPKMTREQFDKLPSNGRFACPDCGSKRTRPYPGCGCPLGGYGATHINLYHHKCEKEIKS